MPWTRTCWSRSSSAATASSPEPVQAVRPPHPRREIMPVRPSYPGVYIEEIPSGVRPITGVATSIAAFVGWAPQGPTDEATRVLSQADYDRMFGGLDRGSVMSYAVSHFFGNGGQDAYIVRLVS